ncbi:MAG TPA: PrsW family glutamic-type intramembrane protease, partial [Ilumatobacteraceae bacterium]|nr:PrsW family glutamic-type intramembrane protease [Ilumatobacteraceae bacterium]
MTDIAPRVDTDAVIAARRAVIDDSGWGARFRVIQPRNFTFWVMAFLFVSGASLTYQGFRSAAEAYPESFAQGFAWFGLFALLFIWLFARLDRYSSIPAKAKLVAFLFAGLVSTLAMAGINNNAFRSILAKSVSIDFMLDWSAGLTAPWSEEIATMLPVVLLIGLAPTVMRCAFDGFIIGAISGLGFQVFESVSYVYGAAAANFGQAEYGTQTIGIR